MSPPDWLTLEEAARHAGVSPRTLYRWVGERGLPVEDRGGQRGIARAALERFLAGARPTRARNRAQADDVVAHVLDAALEVAATEGVAALTLERVARAAGLSLGGVTYHFASKQALLEALCERFAERIEAAWAAAEARGLSAVEAYLEAALAPEPDVGRARVLVILALSVERLPQRLRRRLAGWYARIAQEGGPEAVRRCLAADALWLFDVLGLSPIAPADRAALFAAPAPPLDPRRRRR